MEKQVVVLDANEERCLELCANLGEWQYQTTPIHSLESLKSYMQNASCDVVILDIDTVPVDNRIIRKLRTSNPEISLLCVSKDRFHPELHEAFSSDVFACVNRPIDNDELFYWLKSICENNE